MYTRMTRTVVVGFEGYVTTVPMVTSLYTLKNTSLKKNTSVNQSTHLKKNPEYPNPEIENRVPIQRTEIPE